MENHPLALLPVLNKQQLADWLGVSLKSIERYETNGTEPKRFRIGGSIRYHVDDVHAWIERKRNPTQAGRARNRASV